MPGGGEPDSNATLLKFSQRAKAASPIVNSELGKLIDVSDLHQANADFPISRRKDGASNATASSHQALKKARASMT
jgi:hypothetical protein